jgi:pimeloyl-ACP methyl ester carboxylesterase
MAGGAGRQARGHVPSRYIHQSCRPERSAALPRPQPCVIIRLIGAKQLKEMERVLPNLRQKLILDGAGHWIQQERPDEVSAALIAFLKG